MQEMIRVFLRDHWGIELPGVWNTQGRSRFERLAAQ
jgi:hypothetical protein